VQTSFPRHVRVHRRVIGYVFSVVDGGAFDFTDGFINLMNRVRFLLAKRAAVGAFQMSPGVSQIGKSVQVMGVFSLSKNFLRGHWQQACQCNCDERNFH